ncbi:MAG TPA: hypothetical protein VJY66_03690 [Acholeplasma sp.]|nr:hypothetical protein [Acholeplasma sp.]
MNTSKKIKHLHFNSAVVIFIYAVTVILFELFQDSSFLKGELTTLYPSLLIVGLMMILTLFIFELYWVMKTKSVTKCEKISMFLNLFSLIVIMLPLIINIF